MKRFMKHTLASAGLGAVLLGAGVGYAKSPEGGHHHSPERMVERMAEHLQLTDEQQEQIRQLYADGRARGEADRERLRELKSQLREHKDEFDAGAVQAAADEIGQITARRTYRMMETKYQVREVLTEEQRAQMDEWAEKRKTHHGKRFLHRGKESSKEN